MYDAITDAWKEAPPLPHPYAHGAMAVADTAVSWTRRREHVPVGTQDMLFYVGYPSVSTHVRAVHDRGADRLLQQPFIPTDETRGLRDCVWEGDITGRGMEKPEDTPVVAVVLLG